MTESRTRTDTTFEDNVAHERTAHEDTTHEDTTHDGIAVGRPAEGASAVTPMRAAPPRQDRVRWGPVWAGLIVAVPTFMLLQLATLALEWWEVGPGGSAGNNADWFSAINGLIALFLGGLTAGASAVWRGFSDGLLHGILVWALSVVSILFLTLFGGGALLGSFAGVVNDVTGIEQADLPDVAAGQATQVATDAAAWAVLGLGLGITAAALGGVLGAKMWPSRTDAERQRVAAG
ncbi:permease [Blastococcus goldschmidtiae]|uniref:Permease n=1 Tax=Blastococcus goldschmidtiae TaxID=3075546 RepID=A0ABU2KCD9_9ACTN|nr:permease [Blastococcus sp. DSM 46792]MDT0277847.1 permease [Blastococcus sp. DSM 46792]